MILIGSNTTSPEYSDEVNLDENQSSLLSLGYLGGVQNESSSLLSSEILDMLEPLVEIAKLVYLPIVVGFLFYVLGVVLLLRQFLLLWNVHKDQWAKTIQFPIINHAFHVIRKFFTMFLVLPLCFLAIFGIILFTKFNLNSFLLMVPAVILFNAACIAVYIVQVFGHVYQVTIAWEIFKGSDRDYEEMSNDEIVARQMDKKRTIRNLYKLFVTKDLLVIPILIVIDTIRAFDKSLKGDSINDMVFICQIVGMPIMTSIFLAVPIATVSRALKNRGVLKIGSAQNPLQKIIFFQGVVFTVYVLISMTAFLVLFGFPSITILSYTIQSSTIVFPPIIMIVTLICSHKVEQEKPIQPIDLEQAVASEKPPIVETY